MDDQNVDAAATEPKTDEPKQVAKLPISAGAPIAAIVPRDLGEAWRLADAFILANMIPPSYEVKREDCKDEDERYRKTRAKLMIGIMKSMEVGFPPATGLSTIMIINNRPSIWGDGAVALVKRAGVMEYEKDWSEGDAGTDDFTWFYETKRKGEAEPVRREFSIGMAKKAKLWGNAKKQPWLYYPERMLFNRARAWALRDAYADCLSGLSIAEEAMDMPPLGETEPEALDTSFLDGPAPEVQHEAVADDIATDGAGDGETTEPANEDDAPPPWAEKHAAIMQAVGDAETADAIDVLMDSAYANDIAAMPDDVAVAINQAAATRKAELSDQQQMAV